MNIVCFIGEEIADLRRESGFTDYDISMILNYACTWLPICVQHGWTDPYDVMENFDVETEYEHALAEIISAVSHKLKRASTARFLHYCQQEFDCERIADNFYLRFDDGETTDHLRHTGNHRRHSSW